MPPFGGCEARRTAGGYVDLEEVVVHGRDLGRGVEYVTVVLRDVLHVGVGGREAFDAAVEVAEVEIVVSVAVVGGVDEASGVVAQEYERVLRLDEAVVMLREQLLYQTSRLDVVHVEVHVLLPAVEHLHEYVLGVGRPRDVRKVSLLVEIRDGEIYGAAGGDVVDAEIDVLRSHAVHRVLDVAQRAGTGGYVHEREVRNARFVLAVEGYLRGVGGEEYAARDAELIAADALSADYVAVLVRGYGVFGRAVEVVEVVVTRVCVSAALAGLAREVGSRGYAVRGDDAAAAKVDAAAHAVGRYRERILVLEGVGREALEVGREQTVQLVERDEGRAFAGAGIDGDHVGTLDHRVAVALSDPPYGV